MRIVRVCFIVLLFVSCTNIPALADPPLGYYRHPAIHDEQIIFVSEGDLWRTSINGGRATRLTTHPGEEALPAISPNGKTVAYTAEYEGPTEVYTMPIDGGKPTRQTFDAAKITYVGWSPNGELIYSTDAYCTLPSMQLVTVKLQKNSIDNQPELIPLAQAAEGCYDDGGKTLFFTRLPFQGSHTKRYKGGTVQNLWRFADGDKEAKPLTTDYPGTSRRPMWWSGRVYFVSDRDGIMNIWSMNPAGGDLKQHTFHTQWDVLKPSLHDGRIAYQLGADLHVLDLAKAKTKKLSITLDSDFDQLRENWIKKPMEYLTSAHLSPNGKKVVLTARGQVFVAPVDPGRFVKVTHKLGIRHRQARFLPDGKSIVSLSDESDEVELWEFPANGVGEAVQLTKDSEVLRWQAIPSPDGKWIAHYDKNQKLFVYNVKKKTNKKIDENKIDGFTDITWSPDGKWLAYVWYADNMFARIKIHNVVDGTSQLLTSDRFDSFSPAWSRDGKWLYFLSDRNLKSMVKSPWGNYQPEPFLSERSKVYAIALQDGLQFPFAPPTELDKNEEKKNDKDDKKEEKMVEVKIDANGIQTRLFELPVPPGNYNDLVVNEKSLFWESTPTGESKSALVGINIAREKVKVKTIAEDIKSFELAQNGKRILLRKGDSLYVIDAQVKSADLGDAKVDLSDWNLSVIPRDEWKQMFVEAWRLERDYFYDTNLHNIDWPAMRKKYLPLVERVRSRAELSDLVAQMVSELSALHIFVRGGDHREGNDKIYPASLGAVLERNKGRGGFVVKHIYESDPDRPELTSPLAKPDVGVKEGDVITMVDGTPSLTVPHLSKLLRAKSGEQVLLHIKSANGDKNRDVIVKPISMSKDADLRYHEWEYTRRMKVEKTGKGKIGYVHLRAMSGSNFSEWARNFYPVFNREGLIIDVRNNRGGNIDSWILGRLLRKAWFHWNQRVGNAPMWNMQYAFRGHIVVLCNEKTASDGEAFTEGIKRLKLGKAIGTRTWGGEIWLTASNTLVDKGIATSAEFGVYGPEGTWLIEGHGVEPDIVVDNLPHATFKGRDSQLTTAIDYLLKRIKDDPIPVPPVPEFPKKNFDYKAKNKKPVPDAKEACREGEREAAPDAEEQADDGLGHVVFPTSAKPDAQKHFLRGVKLLHNFEYEDALTAFQQARNIQNDFAMAHWGEAMCHNHPLWGEQFLDKARAVVKKLDALKPLDVSPVEQGFLDSIRILYGKGKTPARNHAYAEFLGKLHQAHPDNHEIACFYGLALLASCHEGRDFRVYMEAAGVLESVFQKNPKHPGVLHYLIHCYDDPIHAPLGLRAAKLYGDIASNSAHALHMPSHIYLPLGMWKEFVDSNEASWQAALARIKKKNLQPADHDVHGLHTLQWLQYGYLQQGKHDKAYKLLKMIESFHDKKPTPMVKWYYALMHASFVVDAPDWKKADMEIDMKGVELSSAASHLFAGGLAALRSNKTGAARALEQMIELRAAAEQAVKTGPRHHASYFTGVYPSSIRAARIMETQLEALLALADGEKEQAVSRLKDAVAAEERMKVGYGPPLPVKPSHELLGEVLMKLDRPQEAMHYFQESLKRTPRRTASLRGLLAAAERLE